MRGTTGTQNYLAQNQTIRTVARVLLELNQNRYLTIDPVSDSIYAAGNLTPYYKNKFTFSDVILPNRPYAGAARVRYRRYSHKVQRSSTMNNFENVGTAVSDYWVPDSRLYMVTTVPKYKYFSSLSKTGTFGVTYTSSVYTNKIVVKLENSLEWPTAWVIQIKVSGVWTTIATNPAVDPTTNTRGEVSVYRTGGTWTTTEPLSPALSDAIQIDGLRITTTTMNSLNDYTNIIELSPRLVADVTTYLQDWAWGENLSEQDALTPVGTISSGSGNITFSNSGQDWEARLSTGTPRLSDLAKKHSKVIAYETINSEQIKMFTAYTDTWSIAEGDTAAAPLFDKATIAQADECPELIMQDVTPTAAAIRLLDQAGMAGYKIRRISGEKENVLPYFYCDKTQTVWDALKELCKSHQYAIWVDQDGDINIATKNWLYGRAANAAVWTFRAENQSINYADIINHSEQLTEPVNSVVVNFQEHLQSRGAANGTSTNLTAGLSTGSIANEIFTTRNLWGPSKSILLGCVNLTQNLDSSQTTLYVDVNTFRNDMWNWPVGYALVDQEVIKIGAARFGYVNSAGAYVTADIKDVDDLKLMTADAVGQVTFTGRFVNCERGAWGTTASAHNLTLSDWARPTGDSKYASLVYNSSDGNGFARLYKSTAPIDYKMSMVRNLGAPYNKFYTRITIPNQTTPQRAGGMVIWATTNGSNQITSGWYVELRSSEKQTNELAIVQIASGALKRNTQKVYNVAIKEGNTYELCVITSTGTKGTTRIRAYVNDHLIASQYVTTSAVAKTSKVAVMATGRSLVQFDYVAASTGAITNDSYNASIGSLIRNIFAEKSSQHQGIAMFYDGFDNKLRGIYQEDVTFSQAPALSVSLYPVQNTPATNRLAQSDGNGPWIAKTTDIAAALDKSTAFSTRVAVGNVSHRPVALDDGNGDAYPHIFGSIVEDSATVQITAKNDDMIKKFGLLKLEFAPKWLTSRKAAQDIADWIISIKAGGMVTHTIESFDNPLIQIGDIVTIYYPRKGMNSDEKFVVYDIQRSRAEGISTTVKVIKVT